MLLVAAVQDAEVVYHLLLASALVDQTELRLDKPPAVESKFQRARSTVVKIIEQATATPPSSAPDTPVLQAVKAFIKAVEEFDNTKAEMRATGEVTKVICVLSSTAVAARSSARLPAISVAGNEGTRMATTTSTWPRCRKERRRRGRYRRQRSC